MKPCLKQVKSESNLYPLSILICSLIIYDYNIWTSFYSLHITGINWTHSWPEISEFVLGFLCNSLSCFTTAKIIFTSVNYINKKGFILVMHFLSVYLTVVLSVCLTDCCSLCLSVCLSVVPTVCLLSEWLSDCCLSLSFYRSVFLLFSLSVCLSVVPSVCLSFCCSHCPLSEWLTIVLSVCLSFCCSHCLSFVWVTDWLLSLSVWLTILLNCLPECSHSLPLAVSLSVCLSVVHTLLPVCCPHCLSVCLSDLTVYLSYESGGMMENTTTPFFFVFLYKLIQEEQAKR